ncbi:GNAT family N-acetyltransferase [Herbiconiux daphne]|uniref:GNAT family N-acetyltransferase n=1 Tax=Herbiconiux daphne TaxID=2970914 RepID=A0ABT2H8R9_9MICO|nr:GNAT family N-acetyltransferase [Herbiconiux daphne]MCS5736312.1 GNAT family N-acetyltransferase [Herbiconiux daphne]
MSGLQPVVLEGALEVSPEAPGWRAEPARESDFTALAEFVDSVRDGGGRKFPASPAGLADVFAGRVPEHSRVLRSGTGEIRGFTVLYQPSSTAAVQNAAATVGPEVPAPVVQAAVSALTAAFERENSHVPALQIFASADTSPVSDALLTAGFDIEARFWGKRRVLTDADRQVDPMPGITVLDWSQVVSRDLGEAVRQAQYETFLRHFGELGKTADGWRHHLAGPVFEPRFSFAAIDTTVGLGASGRPVVAGFTLGSNYTDDSLGDREVNAHTDYIGVRAPWRKRGLAAHLLRHVWRSALEAGLPAASLGVDTQNEHAAARLYDSVGYHTISENAAYRYSRRS